jgi:hypothetical protein
MIIWNFFQEIILHSDNNPAKWDALFDDDWAETDT